MANWDVTIDQPYQCSEEDARTKLGGMLEDFKRKQDKLVKRITWDGGDRTATLDGKGFDGEFRVAQGQVEARVKLGFALRLMKGKVDSGLRKALADAFE